jgi:hypothetical protein
MQLLREPLPAHTRGSDNYRLNDESLRPQVVESTRSGGSVCRCAHRHEAYETVIEAVLLFVLRVTVPLANDRL